MKYKEPQILLDVRKIKERLHERMELEGTDAFFERINRRGEIDDHDKAQVSEESTLGA